MAALANRGGSRRRRTMNEINMVPFIDVMLVLLIIFMVSAPLITTGMVDVPSVGHAKAQPPKVVEVVIRDGAKLEMRVDGQAVGTYELDQLIGQVQAAQADAAGGPEQVPVIISAQRDVRYEEVVKVMDKLQRAGVPRVGLAVRTTGN